jgi:hypothetical protein
MHPPFDQTPESLASSPEPLAFAPRPGRPAAFTEQRREHFCSLVRLGCRRGAAAAMMGLSRHTVRREMHRNPAFAERVQQAEFEAASRFMRQIDTAANTQWRAAAWIIEQAEKPSPRALTVRKLVRSREFEAAVQRVVVRLADEATSSRQVDRQPDA